MQAMLAAPSCRLGAAPTCRPLQRVLAAPVRSPVQQASLSRRQAARQAAGSSAARQRRRWAVAAAAGARDFDADQFKANNKDYAVLSQQIEVGRAPLQRMRLHACACSTECAAMHACTRAAARACHLRRLWRRTQQQRWWRAFRAPRSSSLA